MDHELPVCWLGLLRDVLVFLDFAGFQLLKDLLFISNCKFLAVKPLQITMFEPSPTQRNL